MCKEIGFFNEGESDAVTAWLIEDIRFGKTDVPLLLKLRDTTTFQSLVSQIDDGYLTVQEATGYLLKLIGSKLSLEFLDRSGGFLETLFYCRVKAEISDSHFYPEGYPSKVRKKRKSRKLK